MNNDSNATDFCEHSSSKSIRTYASAFLTTDMVKEVNDSSEGYDLKNVQGSFDKPSRWNSDCVGSPSTGKKSTLQWLSRGQPEY